MLAFTLLMALLPAAMVIVLAYLPYGNLEGFTGASTRGETSALNFFKYVRNNKQVKINLKKRWT